MRYQALILNLKDVTVDIEIKRCSLAIFYTKVLTVGNVP